MRRPGRRSRLSMTWPTVRSSPGLSTIRMTSRSTPGLSSASPTSCSTRGLSSARATSWSTPGLSRTCATSRSAPGLSTSRVAIRPSSGPSRMRSATCSTLPPARMRSARRSATPARSNSSATRSTTAWPAMSRAVGFDQRPAHRLRDGVLGERALQHAVDRPLRVGGGDHGIEDGQRGAAGEVAGGCPRARVPDAQRPRRTPSPARSAMRNACRAAVATGDASSRGGG